MTYEQLTKNRWHWCIAPGNIFCYRARRHFSDLASIWPAGPNDFADPAKVLPFVASQPLVAFWLFPGDILFAVFLILTVVGLYERFQNNSPTLIRLATAAGLIATTLILANGTLGASIVQLARNSPQNQDTTATTFLTLSLVSSNGVGLASGGIFAYGWWAALVSWIALQARNLSERLKLCRTLIWCCRDWSHLYPSPGLPWAGGRNRVVSLVRCPVIADLRPGKVTRVFAGGRTRANIALAFGRSKDLPRMGINTR